MTDPTQPPASESSAAPPAFAGPVGTAWASVRAGRIRAARSELTRLLEPEDPTTQSDDQRALALLLQVEIDLASGELGHATAHGSGIAEIEGPIAALARALAAGETAAAYGDHAEARDHFLAAGALPGAELMLVRPWWVGAVMALVRTGRRREGAELARAQLAPAEQSGDPFTLAHALRGLATADAGRQPLTLLDQARTLAVEAGCQRLAVQLDTDIAAMSILAPGMHGAELAPPLRAAEAYAAEEGLWPLHNRVIGLLLRIGQEPRPVMGLALDVLTESEQRVARLAARSMTNREIAAELGVSIKAIEWHLSRTYRKLGISSRQALISILDTPAS